MKHVEIFGILNLDPESFTGDGIANNPQAAIARANELFMQGANYVDIGAESTRPGAQKLSHEEEWERLHLVLPDLIHGHRDSISLDTYHPETVRKAAQFGDFIINDVTSFNNPEMVRAAAELGLRCIVSHLPYIHRHDIQAAHLTKPIGTPEQVKDELLARREELIKAGINPGKIILDPGIGFGKKPELTWELLKFGDMVPGIDVMIGHSQKSSLNIVPEGMDTLPGKDNKDIERNLYAAEIAIKHGAKYLRVHNVPAHRELVNRLAA